MSSQDQRTYTCRCGKKAELPKQGNRKCGCGRTALIVDGRVTIQDKVKK